MDFKKVGAVFAAVGILAILSVLVYPHLKEKTELAVPVLKSFDQSGISESGGGEDTAAVSEILEGTAAKIDTEASLPNDQAQPETVSVVTFPIDINAATVEELMQIKGIGKVTAENIVSYRENFGYFYSVDDLLKVNGIGDKNIEYIRTYVCIRIELLPPQTSYSVQETVTAAENSYPSVTSVPQSENSETAKQTSVKTTVTVSAETEDEDGGRIIEEITDFEDTDASEKQSDVMVGQTTAYSFSDIETTSEEYYPNFPLELNTASAKDLAYINGVGEVLAERIVEYARSYGFYDVNDLLNVSGIGQSKLNLILPYVYVDASGLPPKTETTTSLFYEDIFGSDTSFAFSDETTTTAAPEIYRVNVNTAGKADFMQLPGIDETLADNIISLRAQIGGFATIEELSLADGMTNSRLSAIWNYIYV